MHCINHVAFCVDNSSSINNYGLTEPIIKVFDAQIENLKRLSQTLDQEVRITLYTFDDNVKNIFFDMDVLRVKSIRDIYKPYGNTALIDASMKSIQDLQKTAVMYDDHAFLQFVITDGEENRNAGAAGKLKTLISSLGDNWTVAILVPSQTAKFNATKYGFPSDNIQIWDTTAKGVEEVGEILNKATESYMVSRSLGVKSSKNLFNLNTSNLKSDVVKKKLKELKSSEYKLFPVSKVGPIKEFVEGWTQDYTVGSSYYQLTKPEKIQPSKQICVQNKQNGKVYTGQEARDLLNIPDYEVKVSPVSHSEYNIFVQSLSVNRKLVPSTNVLVMM